MAHPVPPHIQAAQAQLAAQLQSAEGRPVDLLKAPWAEVEKGVIKVLGGAFRIERPEHQAIALGLAGAFAERLMNEHKAFWFPNRDSPEGATLGFSEALVMLSPFGAVVDALSQAKLVKLEDTIADIRRSLAQVRFQGGAAAQSGQARLTAEDYQRLFDPSFLQFVLLDTAKAKAAFEGKPDALARDIRDALGKTNPLLPAEVRQQFEGQIVMGLQRLEAGKSLADQVERAPRVAELMGHLFATVGGTGSAPEEFWHELVFPLLFIGAPATFPPLDAEEVNAFKEGADPLALFVDLVPYQHRAPEHGLLGVFEAQDISVPHPSLARSGTLRLVKLEREKVKALTSRFDANQTREVLKRWTAYLEEKSGVKAKETTQGKEMLDAAIQLLGDLSRSASASSGDLCLRRMTEAEAASEPTLALVRKALQGPRIILTS